MINNIINNKNIKLYLKTFLILLLILFFLYLTNCYAKTENFEQNNTSQKNTITKNIRKIRSIVKLKMFLNRVLYFYY